MQHDERVLKVSSQASSKIFYKVHYVTERISICVLRVDNGVLHFGRLKKSHSYTYELHLFSLLVPLAHKEKHKIFQTIIMITIKVLFKKRRERKINVTKIKNIMLKTFIMLTSKLAVVRDADSAVAVVGHGCHLSSTACTVLRSVVQQIR